MPFLDYDSPIEVSHTDKIPHWYQEGKIQFITFRLADSLPQDKIIELKNLKAQFETTHPKPWSYATKLQYTKLIGPIESKLLDMGYGSCILRYPIIRKELSDAIMFFHMKRYQLISYVIMPNHVHILLLPLGDNRISNIVQSIKRYSSQAINKRLNHQGRIWMPSYYDRIIRNEKHLNDTLEYIERNPIHLPSTDYEFFRI